MTHDPDCQLVSEGLGVCTCRPTPDVDDLGPGVRWLVESLAESCGSVGVTEAGDASGDDWIVHLFRDGPDADGQPQGEMAQLRVSASGQIVGPGSMTDRYDRDHDQG